MTRYTVKCGFNATSLTLAVSAKNELEALHKARMSKQGRNALTYHVTHRKSERLALAVMVDRKRILPLATCTDSPIASLVR